VETRTTGMFKSLQAIPIQKFMVKFKIDKQTFTDLNVFPEKKEDISVFGYFNYTKTDKGKDMLVDLMRNPINDIVLLKDRIDIVKYIIDNSFNIDIIERDIDFVEYYLNENAAILRDNFIYSFFDWIGNKFKPRNEYYVISKGIEILRKYLIYLEEVILDIEETKLPCFFEHSVKELKSIFEKKSIKQFLNKKQNLSFRQRNHFDYLIRKIEKENIKKILNFTYTLDAFLSISEAAKKNQLSFPKYSSSEKPSLKINEIFHPFIKEPVSNNFQFEENNNLCFLTGANMSGKSTFLKSIGLCVYLSHIGFPVPAKEMETTIFNGLLSTINIADNINKGYSHYYSEVKRVKETALLIQESEKVVVIFDELFRGTNVKDAFDASLLITSAFSKIKNCLFFISTHIIEIAEDLEKHENILFKYFEYSLDGEIPVYNYKLQNGVSNERLGLQIVKNEKIVEILEEIVK